MKTQDVKVILAAGGNPTGILSVADKEKRPFYTEIAKQFMSVNPTVEQFGFLEGTTHLQMSGGEFCGNAARAAALLISEKTKQGSGKFTMSGFSGEVNYTIEPDGRVSCEFSKLEIQLLVVSVEGRCVKVIDMGGIVHIVLPITETFKSDPLWYEQQHKLFVNALNLQDRAAVGVVWQEQLASNEIMMHPVVWVKDIDSFFYETACGSGTLAVLVASGNSIMDIVQPSKQSILAAKTPGGNFILTSKMSSASNFEIP